MEKFRIAGMKNILRLENPPKNTKIFRRIRIKRKRSSIIPKYVPFTSLGP